MAKATVQLIPPVPVEQIVESVTLVLSEKEAEDLRFIVGRISGGFDTPRSTASTIFNALRDVGIESTDGYQFYNGNNPMIVSQQ